MKMSKLKMMAAGTAALVIFGLVYTLTDKRSTDMGGVADTRVAGGSPTARNAPMKPVSPSEASQRATVNAEKAGEAQAKGSSYVAPPVIVAVEGPRKGEDLKPSAEADRPKSVQLPPPPSIPAIQPVGRPLTGQGAPAVVYAYPQPVADAELRKRVQSQIDQILKPIEGGFITRTYAKPATAVATGLGGIGLTGASAVSSAAMIAARTGDVAYAILDRGFNSMDPQAPIFATIMDLRDNGQVGPLHGSRVMGQITYSKTQAAVTFNTLVMPSGYQVGIKGLGITETDGRTGIAANVDEHTLERYSGLLVSGLIQGAGQVGQQLVQNNQGYVVTSAGTYVSNSQPTTLLEAGLAALQPVGNALASAAAQQFNKPATISSPQAMGLGIVFLQPLQVPIDQIQKSAAYVRAGQAQQ